MRGLVVFGSRTWMWTMAAPALAASMHEAAICSGVTGTAGFLPGASADPVTAHEIMTLRCMLACLPKRRADRAGGTLGQVGPKPKSGDEVLRGRRSASMRHRP